MVKEKSDKIIRLAHGAGGILQEELINFITNGISLKKIQDGIGVEELDDGATIPLLNYNKEIVVTADGHTVFPLFFPGGDLGKLSICGTLNDLLMMGAEPLALTSIVIIEEGFKFSELERIVQSFNKSAKDAGIAIIAGDTKVMPSKTLSGIIMATTGIGLKNKEIKVEDKNLKIGDKIIITGSIADHGTALMALREGLGISTKLKSDVASLQEIMSRLKSDLELNRIHAMKDPTRGGISGALNEWAKKSKVSIYVQEDQVPIKKEVQAICDMLGLDPYNIASEGRALLSVDKYYADQILKKIKKTELGKEATIIGEVKSNNPGRVFLETIVGGTRFIDMPLGEPVPRIC
ncbi:MAG: hydrogenase expression/formation protein HypE [Candidatus Lokiarchaeota archaeon]|nr:hydrogenase expression/formation protein HypE [Candidatus Lokiarchaeota archaeon]MBD3338955.1 hydrogenase expression/formation protein HypE [Candidatus Lokiarchaeota archaeon]